MGWLKDADASVARMEKAFFQKRLCAIDRIAEARGDGKFTFGEVRHYEATGELPERRGIPEG